MYKSLLMVLTYALISGIGCTAPNNNSSDGSSLISASDLLAPTINCELTKPITGNAFTFQQDVRNLSSLSTQDTPFATIPVEGTTIFADCSGSASNNGSGLVSVGFDSDFDPSNPNFQPIEGTSFDIPLPTASRKLMAIQVTDGDKVSVKTFNMIVACADGSARDLSKDSVSIESDKFNAMRVTYTPDPNNPDDALLFLWDFNGDGISDPAPSEDGSLWTSGELTDGGDLVINTYSIYTGDIASSVRVLNRCNLESSLEGLAANVTGRDPNGPLEEPGYHYIQAEINDTNSNASDDVLVTWELANPNPRYVRCDLAYDDINTSFKISGTHNYGTGNNAHAVHGLDLIVSEIPERSDASSDGPFTYNSDGSGDGPVTLNSLRYNTDGAGDSTSAVTYVKSGACTLSMTIEYYPGLLSCGGDTDHKMIVTGGKIMGSYTCPRMVSDNSDKVLEAKDGKFFCEFNPATACPVGGGGGGGAGAGGPGGGGPVNE